MGNDPQTNPDESILIDCDTCVARDTEACSDCMMSYLCRDDSQMAVIFDLDEMRAVRILAEAGLGPPLRHPAPGQANAS
ncbi:MAG: hypothetical protein ACKODY_09865 [Actinomycetota bacterium]